MQENKNKDRVILLIEPKDKKDAKDIKDILTEIVEQIIANKNSQV